MKDKIVAKGKWEFNADVSKCFADMIARSIPDFWTMRDLVVSLTLQHLDSIKSKRKTILDIGCSTGESLSHYVNLKDVSVIGIDNSSDMIKECKMLYPNDVYKNVHIFENDIKNFPIPKNQYHIIQSILTLQFIPINYRQEIIENIYNGLNSNGCFIFVEKCLPNNVETAKRYREIYHNIKEKNGYTQEQILAKEKSLENVLIPLTYDWNIEMLKNAGFKKIDCFWKCLNFCGFIAFKE